MQESQKYGIAFRRSRLYRFFKNIELLLPNICFSYECTCATCTMLVNRKDTRY